MWKWLPQWPPAGKPETKPERDERPETGGQSTELYAAPELQSTPIAMEYPRTDRRIHKVFVTRNTEYHFRRNRCVGVRDRRSGDWWPDHEALFKRVAAAVSVKNNGSMTVTDDLPEPGESILFEGDGTLTSPVVSIERPNFDTVDAYPQLADTVA